MIWCFQTIYFVLSSFIVIIFAIFDSSKRGWLTKLIGEVVDEDAIVEMDAIVKVKDDIAVEAICGFCKWITRKPLKILEQILKERRKKWERERERERFVRKRKLIFSLYEKFTQYTNIYSQPKNPKILDHL